MNKQEQIVNIMKQRNIDAILIACRYNRRYLSGFSGDTGYLYISPKRQILMTDSRYTTWAKNESQEVEVFEVSLEISYQHKVKELLKLDGASSIGFEDTKMLYADVEQFRNEARDVQWIPLGCAVDEIRRIKSKEELQKLKISESIADMAFSTVLRQLRVGLTEIEVALMLENAMRKQGAEGISFETIAASGLNSAMPHSVPSRKKLEPGDFVIMDFGCIYEGYCSDMTRTVVMGKADKKQKEIYETVLCAQKEGLKAARAGHTGKEIDKAARDIIEEAGYGTYFGHSLGHSVGLFIHESPRFSPKEESVIRENMVITVEPGIYIPGFGGVRIEDMVIIKENDCENLTHSNKELIEISCH